MITALGVTPVLPELVLNQHYYNSTTTNSMTSNGILINDLMCSDYPDLYAAGDCCELRTVHEHYILKRLWSQVCC